MTTTFPIDPVMELFLWIEQDIIGHSNQIIVVEGELDGDRLTRALQKVVRDHPILLAAPDLRRRVLRLDARQPGDFRVQELDVAARFDFREESFRRGALQAGRSSPVAWQRTPPIQVSLLKSPAGSHSAITLNTTHALGDVATDGWLLQQLLDNYLAEDPHTGSDEDDGDRPDATPPASVYDTLGLRAPRFACSRRGMDGIAASIHTMVTRDDVFVPRPDDGRPQLHTQPGDGDLDFLQLLVSTDWSETIRVGLKPLGLTVNSVFCAALARLIARSNSHNGNGRRRNRRVRFTLPIGFRGRNADSEPPRLGNLALPCEVRLDASDDALSLSRAALAHVNHLRENNAGHNLGRVESILPAFRSRLPNALGFRMAPLFLRSNIFFSNPGRVDFDPATYAARGLQVTDYAGMSTVLPPYLTTLFTPTVGGDAMRFEAIYYRSAFGSAENFERTFLRAFGGELAAVIRELGVTAPASDLIDATS